MTDQDLTAPEAALLRALDQIEELNKLPPDDHGHRWDNSDLVTQEIMGARSALRAMSAALQAEKARAEAAEPRVAELERDLAYHKRWLDIERSTTAKTHDLAEVYRARAEALDAKLKEAVDVLRAIYRRMDYLEHFDAAINDACETFLASLEGDKP